MVEGLPNDRRRLARHFVVQVNGHKGWNPFPSIDPTRSVRGISGAWTPEPIQASMSFERACAGWRDYRVGVGGPYCEPYGTVCRDSSALGSRKGQWRLVSAVRKEGFAPDPGCEWDKGGGFTKSGPSRSQRRFPRSFFLSVSYGPISGHRMAARGKWRWTGATPPFCCPVRARECCAIHICAAPPGRVAPVPSLPAGRPGERPQKKRSAPRTDSGLGRPFWQNELYEQFGHPHGTNGDHQ